MPFSILLDPFFPVLTRSGRRQWFAFADLAARDDEPVAFDWPRADFNIAAFELAIGLATLAFTPLQPSDWSKLWNDPPDPARVAEAVAPFAHAFALDGDGPRFLQEFGGLAGEATPVEALLIDTPGANGQKKNADLLTHRHRYDRLSLPAAAMALYALQQFAPSGGAGNRTSMRGGGPMTTLVLPGTADGERASLWRVILGNLPQQADLQYAMADLPKILPWLAPTLVSDKAHGERVVAETDRDAHPLHAFFGMPRRIALQLAGEGVCAMTGEAGPMVDGFTQKPWGANYGLWTHPLTPYRAAKEGAEPYSVKPKSSRFGYRDWTPIVTGAAQGLCAFPPRNVALARGGRRTALRHLGGPVALVAAGWAMNNMEAVAYLLAEQPLHLAADEDAQAALDALAKRFTLSAEAVASLLVQAIRAALFSEGAKPSTDKALFDQARANFYDASEDAFHERLNEQLHSPSSDEDALAKAWLADLRRAAARCFATAAPVPIDDAERAGRVAKAFNKLTLALSGYGKDGQALFAALELSAPATAVSKKGKRNGK